MAERICAQAVTFVVTVVLARILLPENYGTIALVNVFIAIIDSLITGGLSASLVQKENADETDFSSMFYASLFMAFVLYFALFFVSPFISKLYKNDEFTLIFRVMGIKFFITAINSVQQAYVARKMIFKKFFFATLIGTIISAAVGIVMALKGFGVWALVAQILINPVIDTIVLFITVEWRPKLAFSFARFKSLFSYGWKLAAASLLGSFFEKLRQLVIGVKYSASDLAFYNRGEALPVLVSNNVNATLESVLFPALSNFQNDKIRLKNAVRHSIKLGSYVLSPLLLGLAVVSDKVVLILYGEKWKKAIPFVSILCLSNIPSIISSINMQAIKATGRSDIVLALEFIKKPLFLLTIIICMFISPIAMAWGAAIYGFVACFINYFPNRKLLGYTFWEQVSDLFSNVLLAFLMSVPIYFVGKLPLNIIFVFVLQVFCGVALYILLSLIFKVQSFYEIKEMLKEKLERFSKSKNAKQLEMEAENED